MQPLVIRNGLPELQPRHEVLTSTTAQSNPLRKAELVLLPRVQGEPSDDTGLRAPQRRSGLVAPGDIHISAIVECQLMLPEQEGEGAQHRALAPVIVASEDRGLPDWYVCDLCQRTKTAHAKAVQVHCATAPTSAPVLPSRDRSPRRQGALALLPTPDRSS